MIPFLVAVALEITLRSGSLSRSLRTVVSRGSRSRSLITVVRSRSSVAVIRAYRHSGSDRADSDTKPTSPALAGPAAHMLAVALIANTYFRNAPSVVRTHGLNPMGQLSFRHGSSLDSIAPSSV